MRIALAHSHPNTFGGGERALLELARGLSQRHEARLLVGGYRPDATYPDLWRFPTVRLRAWEWLLATPMDDAIVGNSFGANLLSLRNGARTIYWVHSLRSLFLRPGACGPGVAARRILDWVAVRRARLLVANSQFTAGRIERLYGRKADAVVYPGVDPSAVASERSPEGGAITVGRISPEKGLERLLRSWERLPDVPLEVVGGGDSAYVESLRARAPTGVRFVGVLSPEALRESYARAAVAVFAPHEEEFGIAAVEAMAAGVPVVAWREGGPIETVVEGSTGFLVDSEQALTDRVTQLVQDRALAETFGRAGRERAHHFTWSRTVAEMERLCERVAYGSPAR